MVGVERGAHHILEDVEEELVAHAVDRALELAPRRRRQRGELIQEALPELSADQRELLISGTCPKCWDELFPPDEWDE